MRIAPATTPTEPKVSAYAWRKAPRTLMFRRAEGRRSATMIRFAARPAAPMKNMGPSWISCGCVSRLKAASVSEDAIPASSTAFANAARTSIRWYPKDICGVCGRFAMRNATKLRPMATASVPTWPASLRSAREPLHQLPKASTRAAPAAIPTVAASRRSRLRRGTWLPIPVRSERIPEDMNPARTPSLFEEPEFVSVGILEGCVRAPVRLRGGNCKLDAQPAEGHLVLLHVLRGERDPGVPRLQVVEALAQVERDVLLPRRDRDPVALVVPDLEPKLLLVPLRRLLRIRHDEGDR